MNNILKPKSEEDIIKDLSKLTKNELVDKLCHAARYGQFDSVQLLLTTHVNINAKDENGRNALIWASTNGWLDIVKLLLDNGAHVNIKDIYGRTSLYYANVCGRSWIIDLLKQHGAKRYI